MSADTTPDLQARVARLEAVHAITELKMTYARACDGGYDANTILGLYSSTVDASWVSNSFGAFHGHDEIRAWFDGIGAQLQWAMHFMTNPSIEIASDGQSAVGRFWLLELATMTSSNADADAVIMSGRYRDDFVLEGGVWRFRSIDVQFDQVSNLAEGWVKQPFRP